MAGGERNERGLFREYALAVLGAIIAALLIRYYVIEAYRIPSAAMKPTLEAGDTIFVAKWPFGIEKRNPAYGEVVVFSPPKDLKRDYIKRVVGLPGDTVQLKRGQLWLNGKNVTVKATGACGEERIAGVTYPICWEPPVIDDFGPATVPQGSVFLVGDSRTKTPDARKSISWGMIPIAAVKAKAMWVWLSMDPSKSQWFSRIRFERMFRSIR
jgi:signal peptidase I